LTERKSREQVGLLYANKLLFFLIKGTATYAGIKQPDNLEEVGCPPSG
jgi:hypothetical protein